MIEIYINNEWQSFNELKAPPIKQAIDDSLDTATVIFHSNFKEPIEKNTFVKIYGIIMCVYNDQSIPINKYKNKWQHTLSLIEPTHLLDLIYCNNLCITKQDTLYVIFRTMTKNICFFANKEFDSEKFISFLSDELLDLILNETSTPDIYCSNLTAKECYDELLRIFNARIELVIIDNGDELEYMLDYRSGSKRSSKVSFVEMSSVYTYDSNNMTNNLTYIARNAVTKQPITIGYEGFKTTEPILTTENATMILPHEIEDIVSLKVMFKAYYVIYYKGSTSHITDSENRILKDIDVTKYLIEQEAYDLLTDEEKENKIPYSKSNIIATGSLNLLNTIIQRTGNKLVSVSQYAAKEYLNGIIDELVDKETYPPEEYEYSVTTVNAPDINEIAYQITYYPFLNVNGTIRKKFNKENNFTLVDNQQEEVLSLERYSSYFENKLNRIGNTEIEIDEINQPLKPLNSYTEEGYVVYEREIARTNNETKVHYKLSKDYNLLNSRIAVDQKKRLFQIPLDYQDCYLTPKYTLVATTKENHSTVNRMNFFNDTLKIALSSTLTEGKNRYFLEKEDYLVKGIVFKPIGFDNVALSTIHLHCGTYAFQNSLHFICSTYDNYSSAISIGGDVLGGKKAVYNPYTDEKGEFNSVDIALCLENTEGINSILKFPKKESAGLIVTTQKTLNYNKDRTQRIIFDISAEILSIDEDLFFGKSFFQNNALLQNSQIPKLYFFYSEEETYDYSSTKALGERASFELTDYFMIDLTGSLITRENFPPTIKSCKSWAIADINRNIYVAVNGNVRPIYFY